MRVLVVRAGALGDLLLLRGVVASLRAAGHEVMLLAPPRPAEALLGSGGGHAQGSLAWDRADLAPLHLDGGHKEPGVREALGAPDAALVYSRSAIVLENLRHLVPRVVHRDPQPPPGLHAARWLEEALEELAVARVDAPVASASPAEAQAADALLRELRPGFVAVHAGSGSPSKNWPAESFAALLGLVAAGERWLLVEGPAEDGGASPLRQHGGGVRVASLPLRVLGAALARCSLFVGNDSGVTHLAAAWGAPTLALFGPTDPASWAPVGPRVVVLRSPDGTLAGLGVPRVREAARRLRGEAQPAGLTLVR